MKQTNHITGYHLPIYFTSLSRISFQSKGQVQKNNIPINPVPSKLNMMKTFVPLKKSLVTVILLISVSLFFNQTISARALSFKSPVLQPGNDLQKEALVSFSAMLENKKADLNWTTAIEINISHFVVEKSTDGKNFSDAGMVFAYGNTTEKENYSFSDNVNTDQAAVIYYRLRSVDINGQFTYSTTRIIRISKIAENNISIVTYPNPVSNELRVTIPSDWQNKKVTYEMFNGNGQVSKKSETASSSQTETLNVSTMAPGFYIVRVTCNGQIAQQKILKS